MSIPISVALDDQGNLYIASIQSCRVRKVSAATGLISTVAGGDLCGFAGDGGLATAAQLQFITGLAVDGKGNLLIADSGNGRIRRVNNLSSGIISLQSGKWSNPSTWSCNCTPTELNDVLIKSGHRIFVDTPSAVCRYLSLEGTLSLEAGSVTIKGSRRE